ncbi:MAG: IPT/TIG domain-containing protein [Parafilimonas sp.]
MKTIIAIIGFASCVFFVGSCKKDINVNPQANEIKPDSAAGNALLTITGSGLQNVQSAVFDLGNVPVAFNPNFNTSSAILIRVPTSANVGSQHIVFTTTSGYQFSLPFTVLAIPSVTSAYPQLWQAGSTVTISGNYLQSTSRVSIVGTADTATIVSATSTQLVITLPASSVKSAKLAVTNNAGTTITDFSLVNMDQQFKFFTDDYGPGIHDYSWSNSSISNDPNFAVASAASLKEVFSKGGYQGMSFFSDNAFAASDYTSLNFYIKGGTENNVLDVFADAVISGSGKTVKVNVPANVWTYVTIPIVGNFDGVVCQRFDFQLEGNSVADQTLYADDVLLVKL